MASQSTPPPEEDVRAPRPEPEDLPAQGEEDAGALESPAGSKPLVTEPGVDEPVDVDALAAEARRAGELAERLKRVEAEFLNETRRIRRNAEDQRKFAIEQVVVDLLPVVDALASAREAVGTDEASAPMRAGLDLVEKQLEAILERHGIVPIDALGLPFDPTRHQAMLMVERADREPQSVCEVIRRGYELHGRVVRPAEVIVARGPAAAPAPGDGEAADDAGGAAGAAERGGD